MSTPDPVAAASEALPQALEALYRHSDPEVRERANRCVPSLSLSSAAPFARDELATFAHAARDT